MSIIILGKLFAGVVVIAGTSVSIVFGYPYVRDYFDDRTALYVQTLEDISSASNTDDDKNNDKFQCKFESGSKTDPFDCEIEKIDLDTLASSKKYVDFSDFVKNKASKFDASALKTKDQAYKLKISKEKFNATHDISQNIEVFTTQPSPAEDKLSQNQIILVKKSNSSSGSSDAVTFNNIKPSFLIGTD